MPVSVEITAVIPAIMPVMIIMIVQKIIIREADDYIDAEACIENEVMVVIFGTITMRRGMRRRTITAIMLMMVRGIDSASRQG